MFRRAELRILEPIFWEFFPAVCHVFSAEDAESEHFFWREFWLEPFIKILPHRLAQNIRTSLHAITDDDFLHAFFVRRRKSDPSPLRMNAVSAIIGSVMYP